jgi:Nuclease-related domain
MADAPRWVEVTSSPFPHEAEGLSVIRTLLPQTSPYRAWSNVEFRDGQGKWHEVDLIVLGQHRLHLVELKYYSGTLRGDDLRWLRDGHRAEDSPLKLARRKAQRRWRWPGSTSCGAIPAGGGRIRPPGYGAPVTILTRAID